MCWECSTVKQLSCTIPRKLRDGSMQNNHLTTTLSPSYMKHVVLRMLCASWGGRGRGWHRLRPGEELLSRVEDTAKGPGWLLLQYLKRWVLLKLMIQVIIDISLYVFDFASEYQFSYLPFENMHLWCISFNIVLQWAKSGSHSASW